MDIRTIVENQKRYFNTNETKSLSFRLKALRRLKREIKSREKEICLALKADLHKSEQEAYMCEIGLALTEISYAQKHLISWAGKKRVSAPPAQFHSSCFTKPEPYGSVLIIAPWNYPFLLCMEPLIGAVAAGNCCVIKPSAYAKETSRVVREILEACFEPDYVTAVEGGRAENETLLEQPFDFIFFTGSKAVGKVVQQKAAEHLTPVVLELGGKSPCIVDKTANVCLAAKRIAFGKLLNCGQTCAAPDYVLVQSDVKERFLFCLEKWIQKMAGEDPLDDPDYPKMINRKHFDRVMGLIDEEHVIFGGYGDEGTLQIEPTILLNVKEDSPVMQEEIFGPVLPVLSFKEMDDAIGFVKEREKPLALYLFTRSRKNEKRILNTLAFGGGCINDTMVHLSVPGLPFGGTGQSGMGNYHGKHSFDTFSHKKGILKKSEWIDLPFRYRPYTNMRKNIIRMFLK